MTVLVDGYVITNDISDEDGGRFLALRDQDGCAIVYADEERGQWWLDATNTGYEYRKIPLTSEDSARELLMIIASLLPVPAK